MRDKLTRRPRPAWRWRAVRRSSTSDLSRHSSKSEGEGGSRGESLPIIRNYVKPRNKKYFALSEGQISGMNRPSHPTRGADHDRHDRAVGCGGREGADNERSLSVRQRRVVPTSRCWRQCTWRLSLPGRNGGKRAVLRGELAISRKAIAQGMSDVLRCPVCSCAHFLVHIAHETAGAARIRHSLRPLS
jgi:hypothetical protein